VKFLGETSTADWRRPSVIALLLANLAPVAGVFIFHWEVFPLMFLFWSENVIVGIFNVLRMIFAMFFRERVLPAIPFFCVHYGMFTFVHGFFIMEIFGGGVKQFENFFNPLDPGTYWQIFWQIMRENHLGWAVLGLAVSRGISFVTNYVGQGEYRRITAMQLMWQPYGRIVVLHIALLGGGILIKAGHSPVAGLLLLIALKIFLDLAGHLRERRKFAAASP
jgi:hypothetical protein